MDADGQRRHHAHAHQFGVAGLFVHLLDHVGLVGILERGNQPVDDADEQDAREEADHGDDYPRMRAPLLRKSYLRLLEQLDERDVDHHAARQSERERQQPLVGAAGEKGDRAADAGGQTCSERQQQRDEDIVLHIDMRFVVDFANIVLFRRKRRKNRIQTDSVF